MRLEWDPKRSILNVWLVLSTFHRVFDMPYVFEFPMFISKFFFLLSSRKQLKIWNTVLRSIYRNSDLIELFVWFKQDYDRDCEILSKLHPFDVLVLCSHLQFVPHNGSSEKGFKELLKQLLDSRPRRHKVSEWQWTLLFDVSFDCESFFLQLYWIECENEDHMLFELKYTIQETSIQICMVIGSSRFF